MPRLVRDRVTWLIYAQLACYSYFFYGYRPVVPLLRDEYQVTNTVAALHGTAAAVGSIIGGFLMPVVARRLGRSRTMWLGLAGLAVSAAMLVLSPVIAASLVAMVCAAMSVTLISALAMATLSDHHGGAGPAAITEANGLAVIAGFIAPLVIGGAVAVGWGWRPGIAVAIVMIIVTAVVAWRTGVRIPASTPRTTRPGGKTGLPGRYWLVWGVVLAQTGVEFAVSMWGSDQLREHAGMTPGAAAAAVSAMVAGIVVGRLGGGALALRVSTPRLLLGAIAVTAAGFVVFWLSTMAWLAVAGLMVAGLGMALLWPLGVSLAIAASDGQPDLATARLSYAVGIASGGAPFVLGAISDAAGTQRAFLLVPVLLAIAAGGVVLVGRQRRIDAAAESVTPEAVPEGGEAQR